MTLSQENRTISIETPLGPDRFVLTQFSGNEGLSGLFTYRLDLMAESNNIAMQDMIGSNVTVSLQLLDGSIKYYNGIIASFTQDISPRPSETHQSYSFYKANMVPWLFCLKRTSNCRIFQAKSVVEITEQIFRERGLLDYRMNLHNTYQPKEYCSQYRESDFDFVTRLLSHEGIYFYFTHEQGRHTMIISDSNEDFRPIDGHDTIAFFPGDLNMVTGQSVITNLSHSGEPRTCKITLNDYNFETPNTNLITQVDSVHPLGRGAEEVYDFPADFGTKNAGERIANLRMQEEEVNIKTINGGSNCRFLSSGNRFELIDHPDEELNRHHFALISVGFSISEAPPDAGHGGSAVYFNSFTCIPFETAYRPPITSPKPKVSGIQTAFVTGPQGEEIYTDQYGRVKVQFHWDRYGQRDQNTSCWVRVGQILAGPGWGSMFIPRIGQEVIIDFIEGDPDRPVVIGTLYNGNNMPPYELPAHKTRSTIKTNSTPQDTGYNEIRFEDKKGHEQVFMHAQKDQDIIVRGSCRETIGYEKHLTVKSDMHEQVDVDRHSIVKGSHYSSVDQNVNRYTKGDWVERVEGKINLAALQGISFGSNNDIIIKSNTKLVLRFNDDNFIMIDGQGVTIKGSVIKLNSGGSCPDYQNGSGCNPAPPVEASSGQPIESQSADASWSPTSSVDSGSSGSLSQTIQSSTGQHADPQSHEDTCEHPAYESELICD